MIDLFYDHQYSGDKNCYYGYIYEQISQNGYCTIYGNEYERFSVWLYWGDKLIGCGEAYPPSTSIPLFGYMEGAEMHTNLYTGTAIDKQFIKENPNLLLVVGGRFRNYDIWGESYSLLKLYYGLPMVIHTASSFNKGSIREHILYFDVYHNDSNMIKEFADNAGISDLTINTDSWYAASYYEKFDYNPVRNGSFGTLTMQPVNRVTYISLNLDGNGFEQAIIMDYMNYF